MQFGWKWLFPASVHQPDRDRGARALFQCLRRCSSTLFAAAGGRRVGARHRAAQPDVQRLLLIASFGALSGLYIQLDAPFVAVAQIIIYAGAIMVLFLFVVMLLNAPQEDAAEWDRTHPLRQSGHRRASARCWRCCSSCSWSGRCCARTTSATPVGARGTSRTMSSVR